MSEWKEYKLGDLTKLVTKGTTPSSLGGRFVESGINYIKSEAVSYDGRLDRTTFVCIDEAMHQKLKRSQLAEDDILFSMAGIFLGKNAIVPADVLPANTNQALAIIRLDKSKATPKFIHYYLRQRNVIDFVNNMSGQSAQPNINFEEIKSIDILLPGIIEQIEIASILSSLDDKIDLLHRQNKTLEQLADIIFKKMFVEDAVDNWQVGKLGELINVKYGKDHKKLLDGNIPAFGSGGIMRKVNKSLFDNESVLVPRKGTLSNVMYINEPFWTVDTMFYTEMKKDNLVKFVYHFLKLQDLASMNVGSAVPSLTTEILNNMVINIPPDLILKKFESSVAPFYKKIKSNYHQIRTLTHLRDTLLPKLMSGEVRMKQQYL